MSAKSSPQMTFSAEFAAGFRAMLTLSMSGMQCEWTPNLPRGLRPAEREAMIATYRCWRDECAQEFARVHDLVLHTMCSPGFDAIFFTAKESAS